MLRSALGKVLWVGRATSAVVGLAIVLALVVGLTDAAFGANGQNFILGQLNKATAKTQLNGSVAGGPALQVANTRTEAGSRALQLGVANNNPPLVVNATAGTATNLSADKLDGKEPGQLPGSIASVATIHDFPGIPFDLGTSAAGWKFVGDPATDITTTSTQRLVGAAEVPLGDPTATSINYDLCHRPSGGGTITPFTGGSSATLTSNDVVYTATSSVVPGAGSWDVGFCVSQATNDARNAERVSNVNGWVMVVNQ
jgi:hypothetical protein